ncbi:hypothetical protein A0H81_03415 [Grifola frondosa]|uniref:Uncharacterized protein n=1 Tax=Grifola frondosa TaxID=5627 RepID=A0A1C7MHH9_GRIFR|nr:hypothetical protein A0H81_03415 [Grifola frondosa]
MASSEVCYDIRIDVFHHEQGFPLEGEITDLDEEATHFPPRLVPSSKPVGTIRCTKTKECYRLGALAMLKDYRKYNFGRAPVLALHDLSELMPYWLCMPRFYAKFGYIAEGEKFDEDGAPHQNMVTHWLLSGADGYLCKTYRWSRCDGECNHPTCMTTRGQIAEEDFLTFLIILDC